MNAIICTLFEGDYHYGVAALTNSLYANGFRGIIYAGYRGSLPKWTENSKQQAVGKWSNALVMDLAEGLQLIFIPLTTDYHLTNYKPDFMLELLEDAEKDAKAIFYFDPDICVVEQWSFFEEWITCGVALCEDVNSPLPENHPRRVGWRRYFAKYNFNLNFHAPEYVNGGFVGILKEHFGFIKLWQTLQIAMGDDIGGLKMSAFKNSLMDSGKLSAFYMFNRTDQDALNACCESYGGFLSIMGQEAMTFKSGTRIMSHALGQPKPWRNNCFVSALKATNPSLSHQDYWDNCNSLIISQGFFKQHISKFLFQLTKITSRLYGH
jgi:hypothetical protein